MATRIVSRFQGFRSQIIAKNFNQILVTLSSWGSKVITVSASMVLVRLLTSSLGTDGYALLTVLLGLEGWFMLTHFSIPSVLQNRISEQRAVRKDYSSIITTAVFIQVSIALLFLVVMYVASYELGPMLLRKFEFVSDTQAQRLLFITSFWFVMLGLGQSGYRIWYAERVGYWSNIAPAIGSLFTVLAVIIVCQFDGDMPIEAQVSARLSGISIVSVVCLVLVVKKIWSFSNLFDWAEAKFILKRTYSFQMLAILSAIVLNVDYILISQLNFKASEIVFYAICKQMFDLLLVFYSAAMHAAWPIWAELISQKKWAELRTNFRANLILGLLGVGLGSLVIMTIMPYLLYYLAPNAELEVSISLMMLFAFITLVRVWCNTHSMFLNSASAIDYLWMITAVQAILSLIITISASKYLGIHSIVLGHVSMLLTVAWILPLKKYWVIKRRSA